MVHILKLQYRQVPICGVLIQNQLHISTAYSQINVDLCEQITLWSCGGFV